MPYITDTDIANFLDQSLTQAQKDLLNDDIIPAVSKYADDYCNRSFIVSGEQTETFDGRINTFFPGYPPINSIISFKVDGSEYDLSSVYNYKIFIKTNLTPRHGFKNVEIKYTSAITLPDDLKHALVRWAAEVFKSSTSAGKDISKFTAGSVSIEYENSGASSDNAIPSYAKGVLDRYRLEPV